MVAIVIGYTLNVLTSEESLILIIAMKHPKEDRAWIPALLRIM
jgi:hypothetical protein